MGEAHVKWCAPITSYQTKKGLKQNELLLLGITQFSGMVVMPPIALGVVYFIPSVSSS